jgi:hypothetical protein
MPTLSRLDGKGNLGKEETEKGITSENHAALRFALLCFASLCKKDFAVCKPCFAPGLLDVVARRGSSLCQGRHAWYDRRSIIIAPLSILLLSLTLIIRPLILAIKLPTSMRRELIPTIKTPIIRTPIVRTAIKADPEHGTIRRQRGHRTRSQGEDDLRSDARKWRPSRHVVVVVIGCIADSCIGHSSRKTIGQTLLARGASRTALVFLLEDVA